MTRSGLGAFGGVGRSEVRFEDHGTRVTLTATADKSGFASGRFAEPTVAVTVPWDTSARPVATMLGFAFTQFAMPVRATAADGFRFDFHPAANLFSPPVVVPLVLAHDDGGVSLLAPLDSWHEQVIAVMQDDDGPVQLRWGWHGDLDAVPEGFRSTLGVYEGGSLSDVMQRWGADVRSAAETTRLGTRADPVVSHLSYWTDNGAAYWYRTEAGSDLPSTLRAKLDELEELGVAVRSVELDSWFYPHEISRSVTEVGYLDEVPPTGMLEWQPRPDVLPDGVGGLTDTLGNPPLVLHARHISPTSPYLDEGEWWVDRAAHPVDPSFFDRWFDDAARWGATCIEQDWLMAFWFGVRQLRAEPGRALEWQRALDRAAAARDMTLLWCMATPGDLLATVELSRLIAIRTSDDYRYAEDPAVLWHWYLIVNRLIDSLGLVAFKDCFFTAEGDGIDGDPYPEIEAVLSAMSAGVVGIGDRIGRTETAIVDRLCRRDGALVKTDRPVAIADQSAFTARTDDSVLCWATASVGEWTYVLALHVADTDAPISDTFAIGEERLVYDWRRSEAVVATSVDVELGHRDWALFVLCPIETGDGGGRRAVIGDPAKYITMGAIGLPPEPDQLERRWIEGTGIVDEPAQP